MARLFTTVNIGTLLLSQMPSITPEILLPSLGKVEIKIVTAAVAVFSSGA
ncbi:MAG: hypothetical protein V7K48_14880 [Nostoc sp.]